MKDKTELIKEFERDINNTVDELKLLGLKPTFFKQMLYKYGAYKTAKMLLQSEKPSVGFTDLLIKNRTDLSVEYFVSLPKYEVLFTKDEISKSKARLG